jgi:hypothetical protein
MALVNMHFIYVLACFTFFSIMQHDFIILIVLVNNIVPIIEMLCLLIKTPGYIFKNLQFKKIDKFKMKNEYKSNSNIFLFF